MVSIMVTMLMMIVISLIVLGFAQVSRREGAEALDRQLSTQAFLAAESGVNDARSIINQMLVDNKPIPEKSSCPTTTSTPDYAFNATIDTTNNVSYTCLLVTTRLTDVGGPLVAEGASMVFPIEPASGDTVETLRVTWQAADGSTWSRCGAANTVGRYTTYTNWDCPYGVLRLDVVPTGNLTRAALAPPTAASSAAGQHTMFLYPTKLGVVQQPYARSNGASLPMSCKTTGCTVDITGLDASSSPTYAIKLSALYRGGSFKVQALNNGTPLVLKNAQVQIDATGRAQDVLRRIQVRLPLAPNVADSALTSGSSICKRFQYDGVTFSIPGFAKQQDQNNPTCRTISVP